MYTLIWQRSNENVQTLVINKNHTLSFSSKFEATQFEPDNDGVGVLSVTVGIWVIRNI